MIHTTDFNCQLKNIQSVYNAFKSFDKAYNTQVSFYLTEGLNRLNKEEVGEKSWFPDGNIPTAYASIGIDFFVRYSVSPIHLVIELLGESSTFIPDINSFHINCLRCYIENQDKIKRLYYSSIDDLMEFITYTFIYNK